jgi:hypothetical protein
VERHGFHIGVDAAMVGVDYPHFETSFARNMGEIAALVIRPGVTEGDARKIMLTNAAKALDFDLDALQPHIDRVGFEISDIAARGHELTTNLKGWETPFTNDDNILGRVAKFGR